MSYQWYIDKQIEVAREDKAPETATHKRSDGTWATFDGIKREDTKREIQAIVERISAETMGR